MNLRRYLLVLIVGLMTAAAPLLAAQDPVFAAQKAADDLKAATAALSDAREAGDRVAALSLAVKAYEDGLKAMRESLRRAAIREQALRLEFDSRRDRLSRLLGVLQTLQRASSPLLLIHPTGPLGAARSGQVLAEVTPALHAQAEELRAQLQELLVLEALQASAEEDLKQGLKGVQDARVALSEAIGQRTNLPKRLAADPVALKRLVENSDTLEGFAQGLADLPFEDGAGAIGDFTESKGRIPAPVFGSVLRAFNEADAAGLRRPGVVLSAPPLSLVVAPWPSTIRYRGPFLDYGNVIILEPEAGYLIVLAGLGQVYGEVGQILAAGDPVGLMGGADPAAADFLVEARQGSGEIRQETLYIEIRQGRTAIDPLAWFTLKDR